MIPLIPEVTIAFLGEIGSGKTTLLTRYSDFKSSLKHQNCRYEVIPIDQKQASELLIAQKKMQRRNKKSEPFSKGTRAYTPYRFKLHIPRDDSQLARITWHDYPGGWWNPEKLEGEEVKRTRNDLFSAFSSTDVGIIVLDASKLFHRPTGLRRARELFRHIMSRVPSGEEDISINYDYIRTTMRLFAGEIGKLNISNNNNINSSMTFPRVWIIALSKVDIVEGMVQRNLFTASDLAAVVLENAGESVSQLQDLLGSEFGKTFLLLSSCRGAGKNRTEYVDSYEETIGLELIAPLAFELKLLTVVQEILKSTSGRILVKAEEFLRSHSGSRINILDIIDWLYAYVSDKPKVKSAKQIAELRLGCFKKVFEDNNSSRLYHRVGQTKQEELFYDLQDRLVRMVTNDEK